MPLVRKIRDTNETDALPEVVFNYNLSNIPSETKDVDVCFDDSRDDSTDFTDTEIIRPSRKDKWQYFQVLLTLTMLFLIAGLELTHHFVYRCSKVMLGPLHFCLRVTLYPLWLVSLSVMNCLDIVQRAVQLSQLNHNEMQNTI